MVNQADCTNDGSNLPITKPLTTQVPSKIFGTPLGETGRRDIAIQGIVIHCVDQTIEAYTAMQVAGQPPANDTPHGSVHYMVANDGRITQFVDDANVAWGFDAYNDNIYPTPATYTGIVWNTLVTANGDVSPDYYVINIALEAGIPAGANGCFVCPGPTVLQDAGCEALVQLLAYLADFYNIPIDSEYIQFHQLMDCNAGNECQCTDTASLLMQVEQYCEPCEFPVSVNLPELEDPEQLAALLGQSMQNCCDDNGCEYSVPLDLLPCIIGQEVTDGVIEQFVGVATIDGVLCLVKDDLVVDTTTPLDGGGTEANPLTLNICDFGEWIPPGDIALVIGSDINGCLVDQDPGEFVENNETPVTVIDSNCINLTAGGTNGHEITADIIVDPATGNQLECNDNGLGVFLDNCELGAYVQPGDITQFVGVDVDGCLVTDDTAVQDLLCDLPLSLNSPIRILGDDGNDCPIWFLPGQVVDAGLEVVDTDSIDLTLNPGNPTEISADIILAPAQNGVDNSISVIVGEGVYSPAVTVEDTDCINMNVIGLNQISADPIISPPIGGIGNALLCTATGLYVPIGAGITVADTNCIDLEISLGGEITANPIISGPVGGENNALQCTPTGLFVSEIPVLQALDTDCIDMTYDPATGEISAVPVISGAQGGTQNALDCTAQGLYVPVGAGLEFNDTSCISLDEVNGVVTANPILAGAQAGVVNVLQCILGQGLYVPAGAGLTVQDTACIDLTLTNNTITAQPIISGPINGVNNTLSCEPTGLFVPVGAGITVGDTACIDMSLSVAGQISAEPIISGPITGIANILSCTPTGLYVPVGAGITVQDTNCIDLTLNNAGQLSAVPIISPAANNVLTCENDGLLSPTDSLVQGAVTNAGTFEYTHTAADGTAVTFCEAFNDIQSDNDCVVGVGADYSLQEFSINNKVLTINSEPIHHLVQEVILFPTTVVPQPPVALPSAGAVVGIVLGQITNPSNCRDMLVQIWYENSPLSTQNNGGLFGRIGTFTDTTLDGGATWIPPSASADSIVTVDNNSFIYEIWRPVLFSQATIGPGGTLNFGVRVRIGEPDGTVVVGQNVLDGFRGIATGRTI